MSEIILYVSCHSPTNCLEGKTHKKSELLMLFLYLKGINSMLSNSL